MGCNTSKSTAVVESIPKPGRQPENENKNEDLCTETTAEAAQNFCYGQCLWQSKLQLDIDVLQIQTATTK